MENTERHAKEIERNGDDCLNEESDDSIGQVTDETVLNVEDEGVKETTLEMILVMIYDDFERRFHTHISTPCETNRAWMIPLCDMVLGHLHRLWKCGREMEMFRQRMIGSIATVRKPHFGIFFHYFFEILDSLIGFLSSPPSSSSTSIVLPIYLQTSEEIRKCVQKLLDALADFSGKGENSSLEIFHLRRAI